MYYAYVRHYTHKGWAFAGCAPAGPAWELMIHALDAHYGVSNVTYRFHQL